MLEEKVKGHWSRREWEKKAEENAFQWQYNSKTYIVFPRGEGEKQQFKQIHLEKYLKSIFIESKICIMSNPLTQHII